MNKNENVSIIFTRDEAADIVELFENVLDRYGIKVPSPEDDEREEYNDAKLYGSVYSELLDSIEDRLIDIIQRTLDGEPAIQDCFSGSLERNFIKPKTTYSGKDVKALRKKLGLTQQGLASKIGYNRTTICMWESDKIPVGRFGFEKLIALERGIADGL